MTVYLYGNRKLYVKSKDWIPGGYITAEAVVKASMLGVPVKVLCHKTKNDITEEVLARNWKYAGINSQEMVSFMRTKYEARGI